MVVNNKKVSCRQIFILLLLDAYGLISMIAFRISNSIVLNDAWLIILIAGFIGLIYAYLVTKLCNMYPGKSIIGITTKLFSIKISKFLAIIMLLKYMFIMSLELRIFSEIIKSILLVKTPIKVTILLMLLVVFYMVCKGYEYRAKLAEILIYFVFVPLIFIFMFALKDADFTNLFPMFTTKISILMIGAYMISNIFMMIEVLLFANIFLNNNKNLMKASITSVIVAVILNVFTAILILAFLTPKGANLHLWGVITMTNSIDLPGLFIERQELLFIIFLINSIFIMISGQAIVVNILMKSLVKFKKNNYIYVFLLLVIFFVSTTFNNLISTYKYFNNFSLINSIIFMVFIPILYIVVGRVKKKGRLNA